jgi:signal transduction histidine kinase
MRHAIAISTLHVLITGCSLTLFAQQELTPLPLDQLNIDSLNKVIQQKEQQKDQHALASLYGGIYNYYLYSIHRDSAMKYAMKAEDNAYAAGDSAKYYYIQLQLGEFYTPIDHGKAISYYQRSLDYYIRTKNLALQANCLGGMSYIYELKKDVKNQLKYLDRAEIVSILAKDTFNIMGAKHKRATILMRENNFDSAISLLKTNLLLIDHAKTIGNSENVRSFWKGWELNMLANCYYSLKKYQQAISYLREALQYDQRTASFDAQNIFRHRFLINSYIRTGQQDSAIKFVDTFFAQTIATIQNINPEKLKEISSKYEAEKKQTEILKLQQRNRLQQLVMSNQRTLNWIIIAFSLLILIGAYVIIKNIREKRKIALDLARQELINKEQMHVRKELEIRNKLSRDLHDDIGATLSSVKAYSEILLEQPDVPEIASIIKENASEMLEQLEVIAWAMDPRFDNVEGMIGKMKKYAIPLLHANNITYNFNADGVGMLNEVRGEVRQNIFLIFKEALNNMIKYADASTCSVNLKLSDNNFILEISDDGVGMSGEVNGSGNGIPNIKKRVLQLGGVIDIKTAPGKGTTISISLPYPFRSI